MSTRHRRDIGISDFQQLAQFSRALHVIKRPDIPSIVWLLGERELWLPVWYLADTWRLSAFKPFQEEAIGIETCDFRRVSRYLRIKEPELIALLFRLSIISVQPGLSKFDKPSFRMPLGSISNSQEGSTNIREGFVLERRRTLDGHFKKWDVLL